MVSEGAYIGAVAVSSLVGAGMTALLARRTSDDAARLFVWMLALHPVMGVLVIGELLAAHESLLARVLFAGHAALGTIIPVVFLVFALAYVDRPVWRRRWFRVLVGGWIVVLAALFLTNPFTGLLFEEPRLLTEPFAYYDTATPSPVLGTLLVPAPLSYFGALGLLGHRFVYGSTVSRRQTLFLFVGFLPAMVTVGLYFAGALPGPLAGAFAIGSSWSLGFVGWAVFRHDLFDLVPTARRTVFAELHDPVVVVDEDHRLLDYNAAAAETFPVLVGAAGEPVGELIPGLIDADGAVATRFKHYGQYGAFDYDVTASTLADGDDVRGHALVVRDVTDRQARIRDLEQQTAQLERFASVLSHDLRNPLNVAAGRVQLARETGDLDHLADAASALDRIGAMIEDLLALSKEGRTIDERERVDLAAVLRAAWETTDTGDATLVIEPDEDLTVYADPDRLQNVFENLVRNAVEHGSTSPEDAPDAVEHGGSTVTVTFGRHEDGFFVADDGPGIPPAEREQAFEYEYTTTDAGTGLGLAIVDAIARAHGWTVHAEESADGGARIVFSDVDVVPSDEVAATAEGTATADDVSAEDGAATGTDTSTEDGASALE